MNWRAFAFLVLAMSSLSACVDNRGAQLAEFVPKRFSETTQSPLLHSVSVGTVTGGAGFFNTMDIGAGTFRQAMTTTLQRNSLLAPSPDAPWRLDATLDLDSPMSLVGDQTVTIKAHYVLRDSLAGNVAWDKIIDTSSTKETMSAGKEIALAILVGNAAGQGRRTGANNAAVQENLDGFLTALSAWDRERRPHDDPVSPAAPAGN